MRDTATTAQLLAGILCLCGLSLPFSLPIAAQRLIPPPTAPHPTRSAPLFSPHNPLSPLTSLPFAGQLSPASEVNALIRDLASSGENLYAAGDFLIAGDNLVGYVARWEGAAWHPLGDFPQGIDGPALTLTIDGDNVYVGGNFTQAGPVRTRNIAVWNRTTNAWSALGEGVGGTLRNGVNAIAVHDGQVYAGGSFIAAGKTVASYIARWDGRRWQRVGTGVNDVVRALYVDGNYLYAGGDFTIAGDIPAKGLARYNLTSQTWENAGVDVDGSVRAIASDDRYIYAGGVFDSAEGKRVNNIVRIEKSTGIWSTLYKGFEGYNSAGGGSGQVRAIEDILVRGDRVYIAGTLVQGLVPHGAGEGYLYANGVAVWDGQTWSNGNPDAEVGNRYQTFHGLVSGVPAPPTAFSLALYKGDTIAVGGEFKGYFNYFDRYATPSPFLCLLDPTMNYHAFGFPSGNRPAEKNPATAVAPAPSDSSLASLSDNDPQEINRPARPGGGACLNDASLLSSDPLPDDNYWQPVGPDASTDNGVLALAADGGEVYAGGTFVNIFGITANGIALRRNKAWFPLDDGTAVGVDGFVFALAVSGSKVYVAGQFSHAGGIEAHNIAVWDRTTHTWSALGNGITGDGVNPAFASEILVRGNDVYVGGNFTKAGGTEAKNIARWDGNGWSTFGEGIDGTVNALEFYRGNLYAGGSFTRAGTISSNGVAYWDGTRWNGMAGGVNGVVNDLAVYQPFNFPGDTNLVIGGEFTIRVDTLISYIGVPDSLGYIIRAGEGVNTRGDLGQNIVLWNGSGWRIYQSESEDSGSGVFTSEPIRMMDGAVRKLLVDGKDLYVAGLYKDAFPRGNGSVSGALNNVAFFNRVFFNIYILPTWHGLNGGVNGGVNAIAITPDEIILGGDFTKASNGTVEADHVALWNRKKQEWEWAGNPTALAPVNALALHNNTLYASGSFISQQIGLFNVTNQLVHLTQNGWRTVDGVVQGTPFVLTSAPNGELLSGGAIISADKKISVNVARWNSASNRWNPLTPGSGVASLEEVSFVSALAADEQFIYVGGDFDIADTLVARNIARWNRTTGAWDTLAAGLNGTVLALALGNDGTLYAAGNFTRSGSAVLKHIARWEGTTWQPLGDGINGDVYALAFDNGVLYAAGTFDSAGTGPARNVARWDVASQRWSGFGSGLDAAFKPSVTSLSVVNGQLFAAGKFDHSGTDSISNIARWNPAGWWMPLGSGTDNLVNAMAADPVAGSLYVGGYFLSAGSKPSRYVGQWTNLTLSVPAETGEDPQRMLAGESPNPFTGQATVRLRLHRGSGSAIRLELFDATGRKVRTLVDGHLASGEQSLVIDGSDLPAGVYLLRLQSEEKTESIRMVKW